MEYKEDNENSINKLYPTLPPSAPPMEEGHSFRLQKISQIQKQLEDEKNERQALSKKYHRAKKIINTADAALLVVTMGLGAGGVGLLTTIVAAPIVIIMEGVAVGTGFLSIIGLYVAKQLSIKAEKHETIKVLAESKLNTIADHISKALADNKISDEEFSLIVSELSKYKEMKEELKKKTRKLIDHETKSSLIAQGREEAMESVRKLFQKKK